MTRFAFYGDDFTGSVDALLQMRREGLDGVLVTSHEAVAAHGGEIVVGVAGISRSLPTAEVEGEVRPAFEALLALGPDVLQYKVCSTADSSPEVGSIGRVIEIGRGLTGTRSVPVLFAQPDFGRYTAFSHHFAADDGEVYRLDRQPTMSQHPVTPSTESDLRQHLRAQTSLEVAGLPWTTYGTSELPLTADLCAEIDILVADALTDHHLQLVGMGVMMRVERGERMFVVGSGGLSRGLAIAAHEDSPETARVPLPNAVLPAPGRTLVLSGSASALTWRQVQAAAAAGFVTLDLFADGTTDQARTLLEQGSDVVVHSTSPERARSASSAEIEQRLAAIGSAHLQQQPQTRLVIAGGDTSGNVLRQMGIESLRIEAAPWGMVALCSARGTQQHLRDGIEVALKGGQMGHEFLFDDIRRGIASTTSRGSR